MAADPPRSQGANFHPPMETIKARVGGPMTLHDQAISRGHLVGVGGVYGRPTQYGGRQEATNPGKEQTSDIKAEKWQGW